MPPENFEYNLKRIRLTGDLVSAYVSNNSLPTSDLPGLIQSVHTAIAKIGRGEDSPAEPSIDFERPTAAQIRKSVQPDSIVSFIDGKAYKTLKRHLTAHGLTPRYYCERYGLPADYPMVAPSYAERRSALAKKIGLGRPGAQAERAARKFA